MQLHNCDGGTGCDCSSPPDLSELGVQLHSQKTRVVRKDNASQAPAEGQPPPPI